MPVWNSEEKETAVRLRKGDRCTKHKRQGRQGEKYYGNGNESKETEAKETEVRKTKVKKQKKTKRKKRKQKGTKRKKRMQK